LTLRQTVARKPHYRMKIFNIGKANAEVERLEKEIESLKAEVSTLKENAESVARVAEQAQAEAASKIESLEKENAQLKAETEKAQAELKAKNDSFSAEVEKAASAKALQITSAQGQPPIATKQQEQTPASNPKTELKGLARVRAAFEAELAASK
jgi:predicted RNase H-like nuclease (RuvC/YqgF family)